MRRFFVIFFISAFMVLMQSFFVFAQQISINFIAINPSKTETKEVDVKYLLPRELNPDDVLDTGPLKLEYNITKNLMYVYGKMSFAPKESKTFKVRINDVWKISVEEIDLLKEQLNSTLEMIKDHANYSSALFVRDKFFEEMDFILKRQKNFSGNVERRIEEYRANFSTLENIRDKVYSQDFLKYQSRGLQEMEESKSFITMVIEVANPSMSKTQTLKHKHYLPKEVRAGAIVDKADFDLRFDAKKELSYLMKEEEFAPGEKKTYKIVLRDIWNFPAMMIQDLSERAEIATLELEGTSFDESARRLYEGIDSNLTQIKDAKALDTSTDRHIGIFRLSNRLYDQAYADFKRIEEMISIVRAKKLAEMESKKVKNVLERLKALRGLKQLSEALFKKKLSVNVTWKIVFGTLGFVAFFTALHFFMWAKRSKTMGEEFGLKEGESLTVVPKPGEEEDDEDEDE